MAKFLPQLAKREVSVSQLDPATGKVVDSVVPAERDITIQDLLRHTSGLVYGSFTPNPQIKELYAKNGVDWANVTPEEQIERLAQGAARASAGHDVGVQPVHRRARARRREGLGRAPRPLPRRVDLRPA